MALNIHNTNETLDKMIGLLKAKQPFCYTRFGDTQLMLMDGWEGQAWEQVGSPKLKELMIKAFEMDEPNYLIAPHCGYELEPHMRSGVFALYKNDRTLLTTAEKHKKTEEFWHPEAIHYGMLYNQDKVKELFELINKRRVLTISGGALDVRKYFPGHWMPIPMANAFTHWENIYQQIPRFEPEVILTSCGPTSQILQYFAYIDTPKIITINMGSVFNALLDIQNGLHTRGWIKQNKELLDNFRNKLHE